MSNACELLNLATVCTYLKNQDNLLILTHVSPDGDTLGSAYALKLGLEKLGKRVQVICCDKIPHKYDYFIFDEGFDFAPETVITVDVADIKLLGDYYSQFEGRVDLNIDHHISNTKYAKRLYLDPDAAACAECVFDILVELKVEIDKDIANALYTGLSTDTGCFRFSNVTARTHEIAAKLYKIGINASDINRVMFETKSKNQFALEKMIVDKAEFYFNDKCMLLTVTLEMLEKTGCDTSDLDGIAPISRSVEGVVAGVTLKQIAEDKFKVSLRTLEPINASEICNKLGGGGHKAAAGCTLVGDLEQVKVQLLDAISQALEECDAGSYSDK